MMKVKEKSEKAGLKLSIQKTEIMASSPITSRQIDGEKMRIVTDFIFLGSKITADGDCSHEIERLLLLGRKAMTNLDRILKSRVITLLTKVHLSSVQFSSVAQLRPTLGILWTAARQASLSITNSRSSLKLNVHRVGDVIQPSHPLSSPSPPAPNPSKHQGLFQWVSSSHEVAKALEFQLQHQSFQWTLRTALL